MKLRGLPLEKQQLDREQDRRDRRREHRRHAGGGARDQQYLALRGRQVKKLGKNRTKRAAGHDDGPLGAKRTAGADRHRRRHRFEDCDLRVYGASSKQNRLERLGNPVPADLFRSITRHQTDDQASNYRHGDHPPAQMAFPGGDRPVRETKEIRRVGDYRDQPKQRLGHQRADRAHGHGHRGQQQDAPVGAEVGQRVGRVIGWIGWSAWIRRSHGKTRIDDCIVVRYNAMTLSMLPARVSKSQYELLASLRRALRGFLRFSQEAARAAGIPPQQHQALLAIKGFAGPDAITVGELAERLGLRHHSAVGLVDRLVEARLVRRAPSTSDRRRVHLRLTAGGEALIRRLSAAHLGELRQISPELRRLLDSVTDPENP